MRTDGIRARGRKICRQGSRGIHPPRWIPKDVMWIPLLLWCSGVCGAQGYVELQGYVVLRGMWYAVLRGMWYVVLRGHQTRSLRPLDERCNHRASHPNGSLRNVCCCASTCAQPTECVGWALTLCTCRGAAAHMPQRCEWMRGPMCALHITSCEWAEVRAVQPVCASCMLYDVCQVKGRGSG